MVADGVPAAGDTVTITGSHVITVSDTQQPRPVTFLNNSGGKELHVVSTGTLTVAGTSTASSSIPPPTASTSCYRRRHGQRRRYWQRRRHRRRAQPRAQSASPPSAARCSSATSHFSGTRGQRATCIWDAGSTGTLEIGGDLGNGGNITTAGSPQRSLFNGTGPQTVNGYTFQNLTFNKTSGTATLNARRPRQRRSHHHERHPRRRRLPDLPRQRPASQVIIAANGVLKLGSAAVATFVPYPGHPRERDAAPTARWSISPAPAEHRHHVSTTMRLYLQSRRRGRSAFKNLSGALLKVLEELFVDANRDGQLRQRHPRRQRRHQRHRHDPAQQHRHRGNDERRRQLGSGTLIAANGTTVTYDGSGAQIMLRATYQNLVINKPSGDLTLTGTARRRQLSASPTATSSSTARSRSTRRHRHPAPPATSSDR